MVSGKCSSDSRNGVLQKIQKTEESAMKSLFDELGGTYHREGSHLLPDLIAPESVSVGIWGQRRRHYLKTHRPPIYTALLLSGELDSHLSEIDQQAEVMFSQLVQQMAEQDGITEKLKTDCQMEWVGRMNNIRDRATGIVNAELVFV